jgi:nicotinamidase-related amidase
MQDSALLVIDFINDIVDPKGKIAGSANFIQSHYTIENANKVIKQARKANVPIIFVKVGFSPSYLECPAESPIFGKAKQYQALQLNNWGTEFHANLDKQPEDFVVIKHRINAFYATDLEAILRAQKIQNLVICGVSTDMAVQSTTRDAHDRDYKVTVVKDACAAMSEEHHEGSIKILERIATIATADSKLF